MTPGPLHLHIRRLVVDARSGAATTRGAVADAIRARLAGYLRGSVAEKAGSPVPQAGTTLAASVADSIAGRLAASGIAIDGGGGHGRF